MRRYLIVDDNLAFAENLAEIVREFDAEVVVAGSGPAALETLRQGQFDAMITDMRMPVMSGAMLVHQLRQFDPTLPVIVVTAYAGDEDLSTARREGLLAILPKPVPVEQLLHLLEAARRDAAVAIIEDDAALSDNLSELLRGRGFTTVCAASVVDTERLGGVAPFVALADLRVPGGADGEALLRFRRRFPAVPVLVMTGHKEAPIPADAVRTFHKPFQAEELVAEVEREYEQRRGRAA